MPEDNAPIKRPRGRPPGSKNKPKETELTRLPDTGPIQKIDPDARPMEFGWTHGPDEPVGEEETIVTQEDVWSDIVHEEPQFEELEEMFSESDVEDIISGKGINIPEEPGGLENLEEVGEAEETIEIEEETPNTEDDFSTFATNVEYELGVINEGLTELSEEVKETTGALAGILQHIVDGQGEIFKAIDSLRFDMEERLSKLEEFTKGISYRLTFIPTIATTPPVDEKPPQFPHRELVRGWLARFPSTSSHMFEAFINSVINTAKKKHNIDLNREELVKFVREQTDLLTVVDLNGTEYVQKTV